MIFDIFFAICQTEVDGSTPSEKVMFKNFFDQVRLADELGFKTAWVAETHLSCQIQKRNPGAVIPSFNGEIGLNTDILQLAHKIFAQTKSINVGSAIRNILCNGGPMAHAEAIRTFLTLHSLDENETRLLEIGFASGRFPFSNIPYGIHPRNEFEKLVWPALRGLIFMEASEIFLRFLRGDVFSSARVKPKILRRSHFRSDSDWSAAREAWCKMQGEHRDPEGVEELLVPAFWTFDDVGVIPFEAPLENLRLTVGAHDATTQNFVNQFMPVGVFNLSITPPAVIEETHQRMLAAYHKDGGAWTRACMPRTALVFIDETPGLSQDERRIRARVAAEKAMTTYWTAMEGTIDPAKISVAVDNALVGTRADIDQQIAERYNPEDRLMLWFDLNNHENENVKNSMRWFMQGR